MRALWSDRQNCSHNVSQKVKRIRSFSDFSRDPFAGLKNTFFLKAFNFGASKMALTKARLLKHDFPVHGKRTGLAKPIFI